jgi:DNA-3-methyladenine glycosylase I
LNWNNEAIPVNSKYFLCGGVFSSLTMKNKKVKRCSWVGEDPIYIDYHDTEWGVPVYEDKKLFEFLVLEFMQAGLSWITILKKRENFRKAFSNFSYRTIARYDDKKIKSLLNNAGIIRNKQKISAAINNARAFMKIQKEFGSFSEYIWSYVNHQPITNKWKKIADLPASTKLSDEISKDLKKRGFQFIGTKIIYAHMQATGMVNDHTTDCFRYKEIQKKR